MRRLILTVLVALFIAGCSTVPVYRGPSSDQPSAILRFQPLEGWGNIGNSAVGLVSINGEVLSSWRLTNTIRINQGINTLDVKGFSPDGQTKAYAELILDVKAGENYLVKKEDEIEDLHFMIVDSEGNIVVEARGQKKPMTNE